MTEKPPGDTPVNNPIEVRRDLGLPDPAESSNSKLPHVYIVENNEAYISRRRGEISLLAQEIIKSGEIFPYYEIIPEEYAKMKATDDEFPGFSTPTDELIGRFKREGMKIVDLGSGNVFVVPAQGDVTQDDMCIAPRKLKIVPGMNERLKRIVELQFAFYTDFGK